MVSTFPPLKYSAKIHLRNFSAHAFGQNTPLLPKNSAWCKISFIDAEIRKKLNMGLYGKSIPHSLLVHELLAVEIKILFLKLTNAEWSKMERGILNSYVNTVQAFF